MTKQRRLMVSDELAALTVVLYSATQDCFHIELMEEYILNNIKISFHTKELPQYRIVGVFNNDIEADEYIKEFQKNLDLKK